MCASVFVCEQPSGLLVCRPGVECYAEAIWALLPVPVAVHTHMQACVA
jgi:hypothetical protein